MIIWEHNSRFSLGLLLHLPNTSYFIHSMGLASARVQNSQSVQIIVWMANQSARMISPVVNSVVKIIIKVKTNINVMAVVL